MTTEKICSDNRGPKARILFMDDEAYIRNIAQKMLESFGYAVTLTTNGDDTIAEYRKTFEGGEPYDLVILDLTLPDGMDGKKVAQKILSLDPGACLAISSGYSDDPVMTNHKAHGLKGIIPKPYRLAEFKETVQNLIP